MLGHQTNSHIAETLEEAEPKKVKNGYEVKIMNAESPKTKPKKSGKKGN